MHAAGTVLIISISRQRLYHTEGDSLAHTYPVSTASAGTGSEAGSNRTPLGRHRVARKYGDDVPKGGVLRARRFTGKIANIYTDSTDVDEDLVTSRILWLEGLEPGLNQGPGIDSFNRYIYIHGTNEEGLIGQPASHGCIRMRNTDVISLYPLIPKGTPVVILK